MIILKMVNKKKPKEKEKGSSLKQQLFKILIVLIFLMVIWNRIDIEIIRMGLYDLKEEMVPEVDLNNDPLLGLKDAPVTLVVFADLTSEASNLFYNAIYNQLIIDYVSQGKINIVFKNFPSNTDESVAFSILGECANEENMFWRFYKILNDNYLFSLEENFDNLVKELDIDEEVFINCFQSEDAISLVNKDIDDGTRIGVINTPIVFIDDFVIVGVRPYVYYKQIIESELIENEDV